MSERELRSADQMAKRYGQLPSEILGYERGTVLASAIDAICFDFGQLDRFEAFKAKAGFPVMEVP